MSNLILNQSSVPINFISKEDFYNYLYWDHRIYDIRSKEDYIQSHICRSHNIDPSQMISIDLILHRDMEIDNDYGKADHPSEVLLYTTNNDDQFQTIFISYLNSSENHSKKFLKQINILIDGYEMFRSIYPFLCSDSIYYDECSQLVWPSCITQNLYLSSSICRNETVISMLKITHLMSFSDYPEKKFPLSNIKTFHYQISDSLSSRFLPIFPIAVEWLLKSINDEQGTVLVHCDQGVSRSVTIIIAYLLYSNRNFSTMDAALNFVKSKRSIIRPNSSFLQQLEEYLININKNNQ